MIQGIDVSKYQGLIEWAKVVESGLVQFGFCKATERTGVDSQFNNNWKGMQDVGLLRGAYHFARTDRPVAQEVDHFLTSVGDLKPTDMLVLDIEESNLTGPAFSDWVLGWLEQVEQKAGVTPFVYTYGPFWAMHIAQPSAEVVQKFKKYPLWLAAYTTKPELYLPKIWKESGWTIWQKSGNVAAPGEPILYVPGIRGPVDRNVFKGSLDELKALGYNLHPATNNQFSRIVNIFES